MIINKINNNDFTFNSKWISTTKQKKMTEGMSKNMQNKPVYLKNVYMDGIDFINEKIDKKTYLNRMHSNILNINRNNTAMNDAEKLFLKDFGMFIDLYGLNPQKLKKQNIINGLELIS